MLLIEKVQRIDLGIQGENKSREIRIDCAAWAQMYPNGAYSIYHRRKGETALTVTGASYDTETGILTWVPTQYDTFYEGEGTAEIRLTENNIIRKSIQIVTVVRPAVVNGAGEVLGSSWQDYINEVERLKSITVQAKVDAEKAVEDTGELLEQATQAAQDAHETKEIIEAAAEEILGKVEAAQETADTAQETATEALTKSNTANATSDEALQKANTAKTTADTAKEKADAAKEKADAAAEFADDIQGKLDSATEAAEDAEAWAKGTRGGTPVKAGEDGYQDNSWYYSRQAYQSATAAGEAATGAALSEANAGASESAAKRWAELASQKSEEAGFVWFDVHEDDGHCYATVSATLDDHVDFVVNGDTGHLMVEIKD